MYILEAESNMDAAHFLAGYDGKCGNIHGHRWRVLARVSGEDLMQDKQNRGMVVDFGKLKEDLKEEVDYFDHMFIVERDSLKPSTIEALSKEGFTLRMVEFRPTAENFAGYFYERMKKRGYRVEQITVYETPNNCAIYCEE
ncbi:MAG: 6-pyruvoyl trahydropterin synthase family protein [Lachnospiraceae bacterium]